DELVGRSTLDLVHPDDRAIALLSGVADRPGSASRIRLRYAHRDGSWRWMEATNRSSPDGTRLTAELLDVTGEVAAQQALQGDRQLLRRLAEALPVGVLHIGADRRVNYRNTRLETIVGRAGASTVDEQLASAVEADRAPLWTAVDQALALGRDADI